MTDDFEIEAPSGDFSPVPSTGALAQIESAGMAAAVSREQHEIQAACAMARHFPRDEKRAFRALLKSCERPTFAEGALWAFPRGDDIVSGPSVKLAREAARVWGNIRAGSRIVATDPSKDEVHVQGFAIDCETNTFRVEEARIRAVVFRRKLRGSGKPGHVRLLDPKQAGRELAGDVERQMQELVGRAASKLERNCILRLLPSDLIDDAVDRSKETQMNRPDAKKVDAALAAFEKQGVGEAVILGYFGRSRFEDLTNGDLSKLRQIYHAVIDGQGDPGQFFQREEEPEEAAEAPQERAAPQPEQKPRRASVEDDEAQEPQSKPIEPPPPTVQAAESLGEETLSDELEDLGYAIDDRDLSAITERFGPSPKLRVSKAKRPAAAKPGDLWLKENDRTLHARLDKVSSSGPVFERLCGLRAMGGDEEGEAPAEDAPPAEPEAPAISEQQEREDAVDAAADAEPWNPEPEAGEFSDLSADQQPEESAGLVWIRPDGKRRGTAYALDGDTFRPSATGGGWARAKLASLWKRDEAELNDLIRKGIGGHRGENADWQACNLHHLFLVVQAVASQR